MESNTSVTEIICGGIFLIVLILPAFLLSRLLKVQHDDFHAQWVKDGRPSGMPFWFPVEELNSLGFRSYPWFVGTLWLIKTPDWVKVNRSATKLLRYYRIVSYLIYISFFGVCWFVLLSAPR